MSDLDNDEPLAAADEVEADARQVEDVEEDSYLRTADSQQRAAPAWAELLSGLIKLTVVSACLSL